jgi:hypothetical protein
LKSERNFYETYKGVSGERDKGEMEKGEMWEVSKGVEGGSRG